MLADVRGPTDHPYLKWATYTAARTLTGAAAGIVAAASFAVTSTSVAGIAIATALAALVGEALDVSFAGVTLRLRGKGGMVELMRVLGPLTLAAIPLYAPIVAVLVIAYNEISPWTLPLFLIPATAAQRLYAMYHEQRKLTRDVLLANDRLQKANLSFATALVTTLDARDHYTAGHSAAVAIYARDIAAKLGLSRETQDLAHLCGLVHDIGKIGLPVGLLEKHGPLTLEERRQMEEHSAIGERILSKVEDYAEIARVVRHHHERRDGRGYPDGLREDDIPLLSRILAVADAYNAMTSDRPYRDAMPSDVARLDSPRRQVRNSIRPSLTPLKPSWRKLLQAIGQDSGSTSGLLLEGISPACQRLLPPASRSHAPIQRPGFGFEPRAFERCAGRAAWRLPR